MTVRVRSLLSFILGLSISAFALWQIFGDTDPEELLVAIKAPNYWLILPNVILIIFAMYQRAYRWRFMLDPIKRVAFPKLLAATCIGFMANNILPLRLGEYVRADSLSRQDPDISKSASLATIFVERMIFDLVALLAILAVVLIITPLDFDENLKVGAAVAAAAALVGLAFIIIISIRPSRSGEVVTKGLPFLPESIKEKIRAIILRFARGLEFMKDGSKLASVSLQTIVLWFSMGLSNYFVFKAFGFHLPLEASYVLLVVVSISILIPSSPGFFGVYHFGVVWTLSLYGITDVNARAFAIVLHLAQYIPITAMGIWYLKKAHLSLKSLEQEAVGEFGT